MGCWWVPGEHFLQCVEQWPSKLKGDDWRRNADCVPFLHAAITNQILKADWHKSWLYCAATWWCVQFKPKRCSVLECLPRMWYPHGQCHRWCCWQKRIAWPDTLKLKFWSTLNKSFVGGDWLMKGPSKSDAAHSWMCSTAPTEHTQLCRTSLPSIWTQRGIC